MRNICTVEFYPAVKENEIMKSEGKGAEPGKHTSEVTQALKHKCHMFFSRVRPRFQCVHLCTYVGVSVGTS